MADSEAAAFLDEHGKHASLTPGEWHQLAIAQRESDRLIGDAGVWLSQDSTQAEVGISIGSASQGKGYGSDCLLGLFDLIFSATPVLEIVCHVDARNAACLSMLARSGMNQTGTRQEEYKGEVCTEHSFCIRRTEG